MPFLSLLLLYFTNTNSLIPSIFPAKSWMLLLNHVRCWTVYRTCIGSYYRFQSSRNVLRTYALWPTVYNNTLSIACRVNAMLLYHAMYHVVWERSSWLQQQCKKPMVIAHAACSVLHDTRKSLWVTIVSDNISCAFTHILTCFISSLPCSFTFFRHPYIILQFVKCFLLLV